MTSFEDSPVIRPAAVIRTSGTPERRGRKVLKELTKSGDVEPLNGWMTPAHARVFWKALLGEWDAV